MPRLDFQSLDDLAAWLATSGIDVSEWGNDDSKTTADLWHEFVVGESSFIDDPPGRLVEVAQILIRWGDAILIEIEQEFVDGRRRVRMRPPSEKLVRGEEPRTAAIRCLKEELGLSSAEVTVGADHEITEESVDSPSYPGLPTHYRFHTFEVATDSLPDGDFYRENIAPGDPVRRHLWGWRAEWAVNSIQ